MQSYMLSGAHVM